jgi:hypothetical protein
MKHFFDDTDNWKPTQLLFLQKIIETVNSISLSQKLDAVEIHKIISNLSVELENQDSVELDSFRNNLLEFLKGGSESVEYLILKLEDYQTRYLVSTFLGWFGRDAFNAVPKLIDLASGHGSAAGSSQKAILLIGGAEPQILLNIESSLASEDDEAFSNLTNLAMKTTLINSKDFFEALRKGGKHKNPHFRESVTDIIWQLNLNKEVTSILELLSTDEERFVRNAAHDALAKLK